MKIIYILLLLSLVAAVFMGGEKKEEKKEHFKLQKKKCVCIKHVPGHCIKLRCCEVFLLMPEKVFTKECKYGKCKFVKKHKKYDEKKEW